MDFRDKQLDDFLEKGERLNCISNIDEQPEEKLKKFDESVFLDPFPSFEEWLCLTKEEKNNLRNNIDEHLKRWM